VQHSDGQQTEDDARMPSRQQPHDQPIPQQSATRDLRRRVRGTASARGPDHECLAPQALPCLPCRRVSSQPIPQLGLVGRECRVTAQTARSQSKIHRYTLATSRCPGA
jgi:hypothetical protein